MQSDAVSDSCLQATLGCALLTALLMGVVERVEGRSSATHTAKQARRARSKATWLKEAAVDLASTT